MPSPKYHAYTSPTGSSSHLYSLADLYSPYVTEFISHSNDQGGLAGGDEASQYCLQGDGSWADWYQDPTRRNARRNDQHTSVKTCPQ